MKPPPEQAEAGETQNSLRCEIPCDLESVRAAAIRIREFLSAEGLHEDELGAWELAIVEAGNNAAEHVLPEWRDGKMEMLITCSRTRAELRLTEHTAGFDWDAAGDLPDEESESGRGVFLIKTLMDRTAYFRGAAANVLVLSKDRASGGRQSPDLPARLAEQEAILAGMTEELSFAYEALVAIFRHSRGLGTALDLRAFATGLLENLVQLAEADAAVLRLVDKDGHTLEHYLVAPGTHPVTLPNVSLGYDIGSIENEAACLQQDVWFGASRPLSPVDPLRAIAGLDTGVVHPFMFQDHLLGTLTLARCAGRQPFGSGQLGLFHTFTEFFVIQFGNLRFLAERTKAEVMRRDIEIAAEIQCSLLPRSFPSVPPFEIVGNSDSAREVGGDFFDVIPAGEHGLLFIIADVMGKGLPAALFASVLRSVMRATNSFIAEPGKILTRVNDLLYEDFSGVDMFATAQLVFLTRRTRTLTVATAGHCPLLYCSAGAASATAMPEGGLPLGVVRGHLYKDTTIQLPPDARILLYTDGVFECRNPAAEMFGEERLAAWLGQADACGNSATDLRAHLAQTLAEFAQGEPASDDQTFLIISETNPTR
jgi:serine phosphatase RsbU (regulator of sigma subunit)/anti-sigma regulatory factor (Ser/Thr protein kinase)